MNDRFRFRAIVNGYYDIDTAEEYKEFEVPILLENVDLFYDGDIGIHRDELIDAINKQLTELENPEKRQIMEGFEDHSCGYDEDYITIHPIKIIQCTGLKDKNGKLIYERDIVKINENYIDYPCIDEFYKKQNFFVEYFEPQARFLLKPKEYKDNSGDGIYDLSPDFYEFLKWEPTGKLEYGILQGIEVIGNIYENPELLESEE